MNAYDDNVEKAYNVIKLHSGITIEELSKQVEKLSVPYSIAELIGSGRIKSVQQGNKHCYIAVVSDTDR